MEPNIAPQPIQPNEPNTNLNNEVLVTPVQVEHKRRWNKAVIVSIIFLLYGFVIFFLWPIIGLIINLAIRSGIGAVLVSFLLPTGYISIAISLLTALYGCIRIRKSGKKGRLLSFLVIFIDVIILLILLFTILILLHYPKNAVLF